MPNDSARRTHIEYTPEFKRNLRSLNKKYRSIRSDVEPIIRQLQSGEVIGDQVPGTAFTIFKVRLLNRDIRKGKRSGYRLIYYLKAPDKVRQILRELGEA